MRKNEIKNLSRRELLEMLIEQGKENDRLKDLLREAERRLESRELKIQDAGTMAEAAMALNDVYAAADAAAAQYLENIRLASEDRQQEYDRIISEAQQQAAAILSEAEQKSSEQTAEAETVLAEARQQAEQLTSEAETVLADAKKQAEQIIAEAEEHWSQLLLHPGSSDAK